MAYAIKATRVDGETLWVEAEFTAKDGRTIKTEVACFQPLSKQEVLDSLALREKSELRKAAAVATNTAIKAELDNAVAAKEL